MRLNIVIYAVDMTAPGWLLLHLTFFSQRRCFFRTPPNCAIGPCLPRGTDIARGDIHAGSQARSLRFRRRRSPAVIVANQLARSCVCLSAHSGSPTTPLVLPHHRKCELIGIYAGLVLHPEQRALSLQRNNPDGNPAVTSELEVRNLYFRRLSRAQPNRDAHSTVTFHVRVTQSCICSLAGVYDVDARDFGNETSYIDDCREVRFQWPSAPHRESAPAH